MRKDDQTLLISLALGVTTSLIAAVIASLVQASQIVVGLALAAALFLIVIHTFTLRTRLRTLNQLGIKRWEQMISAGTTTQDCIQLSQRTIYFLGIAATKWLADPSV